MRENTMKLKLISEIITFFRKKPLLTVPFIIIFLFNYGTFLLWIFVFLGLLNRFIPNFSLSYSLGLFILFTLSFLVDLFFSMLAISIYLKINKRKWIFWIIYIIILGLFFYLSFKFLGPSTGPI